MQKMRRDSVESDFFMEEISLESLNPGLPIEETLLSYDEKWEFPRDRLILGKHALHYIISYDKYRTVWFNVLRLIILQTYNWTAASLDW